MWGTDHHEARTGYAARVREITDVDRLEAAVGSRVLPSLLKSIDHLDRGCEELLALSPVAVLGHEDGDGGLRATLVGGHPGFASATHTGRLALDVGTRVQPAEGSPVSSVLLVPGLGETLRVNGTARTGGDRLELDVEEAFLHCAKCVLRSRLWAGGAPPDATAPASAAPVAATPADGPLAADGIAGLLARSPFAVLTSRSSDGPDASPKGDPAGFVQVLDGHRVALPDRPGNRRTDTWHNLVEDPAIGLLALVPGELEVVELSGRARLTDDADLRAAMAVGGRTPKLAVVIDVERAWRHPAPELAEAALWDAGSHLSKGALPNIHRMWVDHVKANRSPGLAAKAVRAGVNERALRMGIAKDYRSNLY
jgi:predicted pyridoxine 5'-phosphate oxidase superfamily flavin-nucleotide-binding protein